jgi:hypothetical protein
VQRRRNPTFAGYPHPHPHPLTLTATLTEAAGGRGGGEEGRCAARGRGPSPRRLPGPSAFSLQPSTFSLHPWHGCRNPRHPGRVLNCRGSLLLARIGSLWVRCSALRRRRLPSLLLRPTRPVVRPTLAQGRIGCGQSPRSRPAGPNAPAGLLSSGVPPESDVSGRQAALPLTSGATIPSAAAAVNVRRRQRKGCGGSGLRRRPPGIAKAVRRATSHPQPPSPDAGL